jgi:hypothetical protein
LDSRKTRLISELDYQRSRLVPFVNVLLAAERYRVFHAYWYCSEMWAFRVTESDIAFVTALIPDRLDLDLHTVESQGHAQPKDSLDQIGDRGDQ